MVNPQLGSIRNTPPPPAVVPAATQVPADETRNAVSSILDGEPNNNLLWPSIQSIGHFMNNSQNNARPKRKLGRPPGSKNKKQRKEGVAKILQEEANADDFQDDPELRKEFQQFKWTLHMTDK